MTYDDLRPEYDFDYSKGVRGKYYKRLLNEGSNVVVLEPDVAESFHDSKAVNKALRALIKDNESTKHLAQHVGERANPTYKTGKTRIVRTKNVTVGSLHLKRSGRETTIKRGKHLT
jgi:hypothetical protein